MTAKYVRFDDHTDIDWLVGHLQKVFRKIKEDPSAYSSLYEPVTRLLDNLMSAANAKDAAALGVPDEVIEIKDPLPPKKSRQKKSKVDKKADEALALCKTHPKRALIRRPTDDCKTCWKQYERLHPLEFDKARRDFERKQRQKSQIENGK